jgi:hypothetical protein
LHTMFLERKYLWMLCSNVQIVINIMKPDIEAGLLRTVIDSLYEHYNEQSSSAIRSFFMNIGHRSRNCIGTG